MNRVEWPCLKGWKQHTVRSQSMTPDSRPFCEGEGAVGQRSPAHLSPPERTSLTHTRRQVASRAPEVITQRNASSDLNRIVRDDQTPQTQGQARKPQAWTPRHHQ